MDFRIQRGQRGSKSAANSTFERSCWSIVRPLRNFPHVSSGCPWTNHSGLAVEHYPIFQRKIILKSVQFSLGGFIHVHTVFRNPHPPKDAEEIPSGNGTPPFSSMISLYKLLWRLQGFSALALFDDTKGCFADLPFRFHGHCLKMTIIYIYIRIRYYILSC